MPRLNLHWAHVKYDCVDDEWIVRQRLKCFDAKELTGDPKRVIKLLKEGLKQCKPYLKEPHQISSTYYIWDLQDIRSAPKPSIKDVQFDTLGFYWESNGMASLPSIWGIRKVHPDELKAIQSRLERVRTQEAIISEHQLRMDIEQYRYLSEQLTLRGILQ